MISYSSVSSACNQRRQWPECVERVNGTFQLLFYRRDYRAQLLKGRLALNPGFFFFLQKHFFEYFSLLFLRESNNQLVDKMNWTEFTFLKAFTSELKFRTNPVKAFSGMSVRLTSITFPVIWSSVLISVTREWRYCGLVYKFFLINNTELKCSFAWCRKYHKSWLGRKKLGRWNAHTRCLVQPWCGVGLELVRLSALDPLSGHEKWRCLAGGRFGFIVLYL